MPRNKPRLELGLYSRPKHPGSYHYTLFVCSKSTRKTISVSATKHHVKNTLLYNNGEVSQPWRYERVSLRDVQLEQRLLARLVIAKVVIAADSFDKILEAVPVYQDDDAEVVQGRLFSCRTWVRDALEELEKRGAVAGFTDWDHVQEKAVDYVKEKTAVGRWDIGWEGDLGVPLMDLLSGTEYVG